MTIDSSCGRLMVVNVSRNPAYAGALPEYNSHTTVGGRATQKPETNKQDTTEFLRDVDTARHPSVSEAQAVAIRGRLEGGMP